MRMSPPVVDVDVMEILRRAQTPEDKARAAIAICRQAGLRVALTAASGVRADVDRWVVEAPDKHSISILGAICYAMQPPVYYGDRPQNGAARAILCPVEYCLGLLDGFNGCPAHAVGTSRALNARYLAGLDSGYAMRFELTRRCDTCSSRHMEGDGCTANKS